MRILTNNARVLLAVLEHPEMTQKAIADMLDMHYQHVWRAIEHLVKDGVLRRERRDRRTFYYADAGFFALEDIQRLKTCVDTLSVLN